MSYDLWEDPQNVSIELHQVFVSYMVLHGTQKNITEFIGIAFYKNLFLAPTPNYYYLT